MLLPRIACEPPLGEVTVVESTSAEFIVALDWTRASPRHTDTPDFEVAVWHNGEDGQWAELQLKGIASLQPHPSQASHQYFSGRIQKVVNSYQPVRFTVKFRTGSYEWQWVNELDPQPDGVIIFQSESVPSSGVSRLFHNFDSCWDVDAIIEHKPDLKMWSLQSPANQAHGKASGWTHNRLGMPKKVSRWFAIVRHSTPWLGPRQGDGLFNPDKGAILASFLRDDGIHIVILALNGVSDVLTTMSGNEHGHVVVSARNDSPLHGQTVVLVAVSKSFDAAVKALMDHARSKASESSLISPDQELSRSETDDSEEALAEWRDGFTYCTWNGVGQALNEEKILGALDSLAKNNIDISNLIIDDNWQSLDYKGDSNFNFRWTQFDANKENFPKGLKHTIGHIRKDYSHISHIAVWHGIFGYWNGISPKGAIAKEHITKEVKKQDVEGYMGGGTTVTVEAHDVHRLYDDFYGFLSSAGVDAVKADVQFYPDYLDDAPDRQAMIYAYQHAWTAAVQKHFQGRAISCMSMTPQILFHSLLLKDKPRYMARNSDDFFPFDPNSHTWHIFTNAHNALLTQHLNMLPDWDMFQTVHEYAGMHAAARCLSGGPIYITDTPGQHDIDLIHQMTAKSTTGRSIILRPDHIGTTMEMYVPSGSKRFLHLGNTSFSDSLLGLFNLGDRTRIELVRLSSFRKVLDHRQYVIRKHNTGHIFGPFTPQEEMSFAPVQLDPKGYEIMTAYSCATMGGVTVAFLGLLGKMSGACVKQSYRFSLDDDGSVRLEVGCKAVGKLGLYLSDATQYFKKRCVHAEIRYNGKSRPIETLPGAEQNVLEFETEKAWDAMRDDASAEKEVTVVVVIHKPAATFHR